MTWRRVGKSLQQVAAHTLLFSFTLLLVLKLDHIVTCSWWVIFLPLWLFHAVVARGRFSLPAPSIPHGRHWAPCHAVVAVPLLVAFELLLCIYLESTNVNGLASVNLKIVFLPLLAFEVIILVDNFRMCKALLPGDDENMSDEAMWEILPADVYQDSTGACAAFLANMDDKNDKVVEFRNTSYHLPAWSVSILPDCKSVAFNSAKVGAQTSVVEMIPTDLKPSTTSPLRSLQWECVSGESWNMECC